MNGLRILIVSPLAGIIVPQLHASFADSQVATVESPDELLAAFAGRPRFDVAVVDVTWNDPRYEWDFDGLDVMAALRRERRRTPVVMAAQGHSFETEHLREALDPTLHPDVMASVKKSDGLPALRHAIEAAAAGIRLEAGGPPPRPALHHYFAKGRGRTAARLAAAVASGRANRYESLATVAHVAHETAAKLVGYLQPIITARGELPVNEPLTQAAVYRWCGEHARYLLSWQRRNDPETSITRWRPAG